MATKAAERAENKFRQNRWQTRQVSARRCRHCGKRVSDGKSLCKVHREISNARQRRDYEKRAAAIRSMGDAK